MDDQQLLTPDQVAERLQLSIYTILDYLRHGHPKGGKLRGVKFGKQWRIREADLQEFIEANLSNGDRPHPVLVTPAEPEPADPRPDTLSYAHRREALVRRLQAMQAEGLSLQAMANRLQREGVPTISGRGQWRKGTISDLLAEAEAVQP